MNLCYITTVFLSLAFLSLMSTTVFAFEFDMDISVSPTNKLSNNCGGQESVTVSLTNKGNYYGALCWWSLDKSSWTKGTNSCLSPEGGSGSFSINLDVPTSGSTTHSIYVTCRNYGHREGLLFHTYYNDCENSNSWSSDYTEGYTKNTNCLINNQQDADCVYEQTVSLQCNVLTQQSQAEINTAQNLINDAQSSVNSAKSKINEVSAVGADITQANSYQSSANTALNNAQTYLSTAQTSYASGNYESAKSSAKQAQTYANNAKSNANQAKSSAEQAMQQVTRQKTESSNKISGASSAIDNAKKTIKEAEGLINNATVIGMDTTQSEGDVATARSKLQSAEDYYKDATTAFDADNYDLAKQKASTAESHAGEADSKASSSYNSLWVVYSKKRVAAGAITSADSEVSQMNEINTKMTYVLRNMETYGVDISETQTVAEECKSNTDSAEDLLSQSKNRMSSGYTDDAVNLAVQARDNAATSHNRLDTIVLKLKFGIQDALEAGYNQKLSNLEEAKGAVQSASETYGADEVLVIKAQEDAANAESILKEAKSKMDLIDGSDSLSDLLTNAKSAFEALERTQEEADKAKESAENAKMVLYQSVAAGAAGIAALGGGFLYWRRKKKKVDDMPEKKEERKKSEKKHEKKKEEKKHKTKHKEEKKKKDEGKFCGHCGAKVQKEQTFCGKCGKKVR